MMITELMLQATTYLMFLLGLYLSRHSSEVNNRTLLVPRLTPKYVLLDFSCSSSVLKTWEEAKFAICFAVSIAWCHIFVTKGVFSGKRLSTKVPFMSR